MKIFNLMFGKDLGGLEQASFDYALALHSRGHEVITYLNPQSAMIPAYKDAALSYRTTIKNKLGGYDLFAKQALRKEIKEGRPDLCITHGRRATLFAKNNKVCPTLAVSHSFNLAPLKGVDGLIAINESMKERALQEGFPQDSVQVVHNMLPETEIRPRQQPDNTPLLIGAMGRLVPRKGMLVFLTALETLKEQNTPFQAWIAGTGEQEDDLKEFIKTKGLSSHVEMKGWMDASAFYETIDIFCMPSSAEPFGLVLLEAWRYGVPLCATASSGPAEIITDQETGLLSPVDEPHALAKNLKRLLLTPDLRSMLRTQGYQTVENQFLLPAGAKRLEDVLTSFLIRFQHTLKRG